MEASFRFEACEPAPGDRLVGWCCSYTPEELILAAGLAPYRLGAARGGAEGAEAFLPPNLCAYAHGLLEAGLSGRFGDVCSFLFVSSCDAMRRLADSWALYVKGARLHRLDVPRLTDREAEDFLVAQLEALRAALAKESGRDIGPAELAAAVSTVNETRRLMARISRLRAGRALSGAAFQRIAACAMRADKKRFNAEAERFLSQTGGQADKSRRIKRPALLLCGCVAEGPEMIELIEQCGADVIADDLCSGARHFDGLVDTSLEPLRAIARRYLQRAACARMAGAEARRGHAVVKIVESAAEGIIYLTLKFCDLVQADLPGLRDELQRRSIPLLHIERDSPLDTGGQLRTRIEAFVEMLGSGR